jgi:hypothetical protein
MLMQIEVRLAVAVVALSLAVGSSAFAHDDANDQLIPGGGSEKTDCLVQFYGGDLNIPAPPKPAKKWRCYDGDETCDQGGAGDGVCEFAIGVCLNGTSHPECAPSDVASVLVKNKPVGDAKYDAGLAALQSSIDALGLPTTAEICTVEPATVTVPLKAQGKPGSKNVKLKSASSPSPLTDKVTKDSDTLKLRCETCPASGTFDNIAQFVFSGSCATGTCHIGPTPTGGLNLEPASAHAELVNVVPDNPAAAAAGMKLVDPGNADNSYLLDKLCGPDPGDPDPRPAVCGTHDLSSGEGDAMPPPTGGLAEAKINAIYDWIAAGAPATGWVPGTHCGVPADVFTPAAPLTPPAAPGFQLELPSFDLAPGQEIEGCMWVQVPLSGDLDVGAFEIAMNENSHHFILFRYIDDGNAATPLPALNVWNPGDIACGSGGFFKENLSGSQDPHVVDAYPDGLARTLHAGDIIGLNSHYINTLNIPIQGHVYVNIYPYTGTEPHKTAKTLFAIDANYAPTTGISLGGPGIAPFQQGITPGNWQNPETGGACIVQLTSHMHKRGILFREEYPVGNEIYSNSDWDHPDLLRFPTPLWVPHNDVIHYECTHDNGFSNPNDVKRNNFGVAANLHFGFSADDEMCIMPGLYFVPSVAGDCSLP